MKILGYSRDNYNTTLGILDQIDYWTNQSVITTSDPTFNSLTLINDIIVGGNAVISGNLTVEGATTIVSSDTVEIKDNIIEINSGQVTPGVSLGSAGIEVNRGPLTPYRFVYEEASQYFKIGQIGSLQVVATREDTPLNKGIMVYNSTLNRLDSTQTIELPITFNAGSNSISSSTGTIKITGGLGITQDISTDGILQFLGSGLYNTKISVDNLDNIIFTLPSNKYISFPATTSISLNGSANTKRIISDGTNVAIDSTIGTINLNTTSSVVLPESTFLRWGTGNNTMTFNGTNMSLQSTGRFVVTPQFQVLSGLTSTSNSTGSVLLSGGIGINSTANAESSLNGGTLTTAGGAAISRRLYVGEQLDVADVSTTRVQTASEGINFRSRARILNTSTATGTTFNTFEGGIINTSATIPTAATVSILAAPTSTGGGSITNSYALDIVSGTSRIAGLTQFINTTSSSSSTSASIVTSGGVSINHSTNASSVNSGGALTVTGGAAIARDTHIGGYIDIGVTSVTGTQVFGQGINLRSRNKTLTTTSGTSTVFNSFEGGSINSTSNIIDAATVYISSGPTAIGVGTIDNSYALWVNGLTRLDNLISVTGTTPSTSSTTGVITIAGGVGIDNSTDAVSSTNGGTFTTAGGIAVAKKIYTGLGLFTNMGTAISSTPHISLLNGNVYRFGLGLKNIETGLNTGSDFTLSRTNDADTLRTDVLTVRRATGDITIHTNTPSSSISEGSLILTGGLSIGTTMDASSVTNGGSFTTAGGAAIAKKLYVGGHSEFSANVDIDGITYLDQVFVNTTDGSFSVTGPNSASITVGNTSNFTTTSGSLSLVSQAGTVIVDGTNAVTIDSTGGVSIDAASHSNFTTTSGNMTLSATNGTLSVSGSGNTSLTSTSGAVTVIGNTGLTLSSPAFINIGTSNAGTNVTIGNAVSDVFIGDNLIINGDLTVLGSTTSIESTFVTVNDNCIAINNAPTGTSDGGYIIRRYQTPNNAGTGEVVNGLLKESGLFQVGSTLPDTLILDSSASSVNNYYRGWWIRITSGAGAGQVRRILSYNGTSKQATLYSDANTNANNDGLDLVTAPLVGEGYNLYDAPYVGMCFDESNKEISFAGISFDIDQGQFPEITSYYAIHAKKLVVEEGFTTGGDMGVDGNLTVDHNSTTALLIRKNGDSGDVFKVDTINSDIFMSNPVNTLNSDVLLSFQQRDATNNTVSYSTVKSVLKDNVSGNFKSNLIFSVQNDTAGLTDFLSIKGENATIDVSSSVLSFNILNSTSSTSNTTGAFRISGGIGISNTADASSITNGGTFTTAGGAAIAKKLFVGDNTFIAGDTVVGDSNPVNGARILTVSNSSSGVNAYTSLFLDNDTANSMVMFLNSSSRVLDGGINTGTLRNDAGTLRLQSLGNNGITIASTTGYATAPAYIATTDGFTITNGSTFSSLKEVSEITVFKPHNTDVTKGFEFRDAAGSLTRSRINSDGFVNHGLSNVIGLNASILKISGITYTDTSDNLTTVPTQYSVDIRQSTFASTNNVTTTDAVTAYIQGSPIKGTNNTVNNAYALYIDNTNNITPSGTVTNAASLYIKGAPSGTITNSYALFVDSGLSRLDGNVNLTSSTVISDNTNSLSTPAFSIIGDTVTQGKLFFDNATFGTPSLVNRNSGYRMVLNPSTTVSTVDTAIGVSSGGNMWFSAPDNSSKHSFYLGNSEKIKIENVGLTLDTTNNEYLIKLNTIDGSDNKGITLTSGGSSGFSRGAEIQLYGNEHTQTGNAIISAGGLTGIIDLKTNNVSRLSIANTGEITSNSVADSTAYNNGSFVILGGLGIAKNTYIGQGLHLDFNQRYSYTGNGSGHLDISSKTSSIASRHRYFTNDGDNTDDNLLEIFGTGIVSNTTNSEYLRIGYDSSLTRYVITTLQSGSGVSKNIVVEANGFTNQFRLLTDGTISCSSSTSSSDNVTGAFKLAGGIAISNTTDATSTTNGGTFTTAGGAAIAKKLFVGTDLVVSGTITGGITNPSLSTSNLTNTASVTSANIRLLSNGLYRTLTAILRCSPTASNTVTSFEITLPGLTTNFTNIYDTVNSLNIYHNDTTPESVENCIVFSVISSTRIGVSFTSADTDTHTIQLTCNYSV